MKIIILTVLSLILALGITMLVFSQANRTTQCPAKTSALTKAAETALEDAIRKELQDIYGAVDRHDAAAAVAHFAEGEELYYALNSAGWIPNASRTGGGRP